MTEALLYILLILSISLNVFGFVYIRWILSQYAVLDSAIKNMFDDLVEYEEHAKSIHNTEVFYGDTTLQGLIRHTEEMSEQIKFYKDYLYPEENENYESDYEEEKKEN